MSYSSYEEWQQRNQEWQQRWQQWQQQNQLHLQQQQMWAGAQTQAQGIVSQQVWQQQWNAYAQQQQQQQPYGQYNLRGQQYTPRQQGSRPYQARQEAKIACEPCNKQFVNRSQYNAHIACHEVCAYEGCQFSACKRVLQSHYETMHGQYQGTGLTTIDIEGQKFQVLLGTDPDEVKQWREERRKNWPSRANVERKREEQVKRKALAPEDDLAKKSRKLNPCIFFLHTGKCNRGEDCKFSHEVKSIPLCPHILKRGSCKRGFKCRQAHFDHEVGALPARPTSQRRTSSTISKPSLLRKLLEPDIKRETGLILNIFRHLIDQHRPPHSEPSSRDDSSLLEEKPEQTLHDDNLAALNTIDATK